MTILRSRPLFLLIVLLTLSGGLIALHKLGYLAPTERFVVQFVAPLQQGVSRIARGMGSLPIGLGDVQRLRGENEALRGEVDRLRSLVIGLKEAENENRLLREQIGFIQAHPAYDLLPAQVIGRDPDNLVQSIMIDKGTRDGVREGKVVVAAGTVTMPTGQGAAQPGDTKTVVQGLVGRVIETGPNYARVLLITDLSSAVNVYVQDSQAEGLLAGLGRGIMQLKYVRQGEKLSAGDIVLTSGLGGGFPRGLTVGVVTDVQTKDQATFQTGTVVSLVDLQRINVLFVIRSFDPIKVGS
jgi:rod shape-determining protein MreC